MWYTWRERSVIIIGTFIMQARVDLEDVLELVSNGEEIDAFDYTGAHHRVQRSRIEQQVNCQNRHHTTRNSQLNRL